MAEKEAIVPTIATDSEPVTSEFFPELRRVGRLLSRENSGAGEADGEGGPSALLRVLQVLYVAFVGLFFWD